MEDNIKIPAQEAKTDSTKRCRHMHCHCTCGESIYCSRYCRRASDGPEPCECDHEQCKKGKDSGPRAGKQGQ